MEQQQNQKPKGNPVAGFIILAIIIGAPILWFMHLGSSGKSATNNSNSDGNTTYSATVNVGDSMVLNPASLRVFGVVHNTGTVAGTPSCTLQAHDDGYNYTGTDVVTRTSLLNPGGQWNFGDDMTITHQGAQYVTTVDVNCQ
jgi:hypothetical protein